mmetsp:Transcript_92466/g.193309  ORF Transcript_92466/g.193309 Transcript_92466/m.193309 type:complete len:363 (-) Transcript_92466:503-1591(-)
MSTNDLLLQLPRRVRVQVRRFRVRRHYELLRHAPHRGYHQRKVLSRPRRYLSRPPEHQGDQPLAAISGATPRRFALRPALVRPLREGGPASSVQESRDALRAERRASVLLLLHLRRCSDFPEEEPTPLCDSGPRGSVGGLQDAQDQSRHRVSFSDHYLQCPKLLRRLQQQGSYFEVRQQHVEHPAAELLAPSLSSAQLHGRLYLEHALRHREGHGDALLHLAAWHQHHRSRHQRFGGRCGGDARGTERLQGFLEQRPERCCRACEKSRPQHRKGRDEERRVRGRRGGGSREDAKKGPIHRQDGPNVQDVTAGKRDDHSLEGRMSRSQARPGPAFGRQREAQFRVGHVPTCRDHRRGERTTSR